ncbi:hypothetical protein K2X40_02180 [Candidatus Babeliales bacterium]|nr:hypothetical protein [Candidatus Babeliales bacterium]
MKKKFLGILLVGLFFVVGNGYGAYQTGLISNGIDTLISDLKEVISPETKAEKTQRLGAINTNGNTYLTTTTKTKGFGSLFGSDELPATKQKEFVDKLNIERDRISTIVTGSLTAALPTSHPSNNDLVGALILFANLNQCTDLRNYWPQIDAEIIIPAKDAYTKQPIPFLKWNQFLTNAYIEWQNNPLKTGYSSTRIFNRALELIRTAPKAPATPLDQLTTSLTALKAKLAALATALNGLGH